jgi:hypothetical protein
VATLPILVTTGGVADAGFLGAVVPHAHATPAPGEPGGNHSKPGDNKKKRNDNTNNRSPFDRGSDTQQPNSQPSQTRQPPQSRIDATQIDQTDQNNRLTPDGPDRSVGIRTGDDGVARQGPPDERPTNVNPADAAERSAELQDGIPGKRVLTASEQETYDYFRGPNAARRLPSSTAARGVQERFANGDLPYNDHPFGRDFNAGKPTVDHLVPVRRVVQMPGFNDLDRATQESIIDSNDNLVLTPLRENTSRQDLTYAEWPGRQTGPPLDPAYQASRIAQESEVYRQLQERIDTAFTQQFPGRPLPSAGPLEIDRTAPPLDINPNIPPESMPLQPGPELPVNSPVELPAAPAPVELPANPVPAVPNYPLPPAAQPSPPIVNPGPPAIGNPPPVVLPNPEPPPVGAPQTPPITNPIPPAVVDPNPVSPWDVLFPGAVPAPTSPLGPMPGNVLTYLPPAATGPATTPAPVEPSIRVPVGEILKRLPAELLEAPGLLIPLPAPVGLCSVGACNQKPVVAMLIPPLAVPVFVWTAS